MLKQAKDGRKSQRNTKVIIHGVEYMMATCARPDTGRLHGCNKCRRAYPVHYMTSSGHCYECYCDHWHERAIKVGVAFPGCAGSIRDIAGSKVVGRR